MKAAFFSVFALAMSAFAAPVTESDIKVRDADSISNAVKLVESIEVRSPGVEVEEPTHLDKRTVGNSKELITTLTTCHTGIKTQCGHVNALVVKYKAGTITKTQCATQCVPYFKSCVSIIQVVITKCTGTGALTVIAAEVDIILKLVVSIVTEILTCIKVLVTACGLQSVLVNILNALIVIICKLLVLVIGIVAAIVPGLVAALTPLLSSLGLLLGVILTPLILLIAGLGM